MVLKIKKREEAIQLLTTDPQVYGKLLTHHWRGDKDDEESLYDYFPSIRFQDPATLDTFELWGACGDLNLPSLPTHDPPEPSATSSKRQRDTSV